MSDPNPLDQGPAKGFSFGFSKTISSKPKFVPQEIEKEALDYIKDVKNGKIEGSIAKEVKVELVIPCTGNKIKFPRVKEPQGKPQEEEPTGPLTESELAARELVKEAQKWELEKDREAEGRGDPNLVVPLNPDNKDFLDADVAERAEASNLDDYENIPIEGFGLGMLRGMGFKEKEGIGGFKKAAVGCIEPTVRPKGLGLGAAKPGQNKVVSKRGDQNVEELVLKKGAYVHIESGAHKNLYGQVDGLDEESARVIVRLALGGQTVSVSENVTRVVDKTEFKEFGKVINKDSYSKYKDKQKEREDEWNRDRSNRERDRPKESRDSRPRSRSKSRDRSDSKQSKDEPKKSRENGSRNGGSKKSWVQAQLRVRLIDKHYKSGKFYNEKVIVEDVISNDKCICRTDSGIFLDDVSTSKCETVIPKAKEAVVMIVRGSNMGRLATIVARDKGTSRATLQILPDKEDIVTLSYDDVCDYAGDTSYM